MTALEDRLTDALAARARLEDVDAATLSRFREEVLGPRGDEDAVHLHGRDTGLTPPDAPSTLRDLRDRPDPDRRRRRVLQALAAAAAVTGLVAAGLGLSGRLAVVATPASPSEVAAGYPALDRPQEPDDLAGAPDLGQPVVAGTIRRVLVLGGSTYWVGVTAEGNVCWATEHPGGSSGGCELGQRRSGQPLEAIALDDAEPRPTVWLSPTDDDPRPRERDGYVEAQAGLWVDADAVGSGPDQLAVLRRDAQPDDAFPAAVGWDAGEEGSERLLARTLGTSYWAALTPRGQVCLVVLLEASGTTGASCADPLALAQGDGPVVGVSDGTVTVDARLAPDAFDAATWEAEGWVKGATNVWVSPGTPAVVVP